MDDHDREAILARRLLFISAALTGLACTTHGPASEPTSVESPLPPVQPIERDPIVTSDGDRPTWAELMAQAPPLDVPAGLTDRERDLLTSLASDANRRYEQLATLWNVAPECPPSDAGCEDWTAALERIREATREWGWLCGYSSETTHTYLERHQAHAGYRQRIAQTLRADLDAAVEARVNAADSEAWQTARAQADRASPRPCLSCVKPSAVAITSAVSFAADQVELPSTEDVDRTLGDAARMHEHNRQFKATLIVRGHADVGEREPESLARARAEAVAAKLLALGVPRSDIEVRSYSASLPITRDPAEVERNARVDFEVVEPGR